MTDQHPAPQEDEINLLDYVIVVLKHKEFIIKTTLAAMALAAVVSLMLPPVYQATTMILPPQQQGSSTAGMFASQMSMMGFSTAALGLKNSNDLFVALIKSAPVLDYVINAKKLDDVYGIKARDIIRNRVVSKLDVYNDKRTGLISISYQDRNPELAAAVCNDFVDGLSNLNRNLAITDASQRRLFFEKQLALTNENLNKAATALQAFQRRTGTVQIDDQAKATIEETAHIQAEISAREVQARVMQSYATQENPELQKIHDEITALKGQLNELGYSGSDDNSLLSARKISSYGMEFAKAMRDYKYNESLYEILMKQYEIAKLDEARDPSVIQVVESAEVPMRRFKPARTQIVVKTGIYVFFISIFLVLGRSYLDKLKAEDPGYWAQIKGLSQYLDLKQLMADLKLNYILDKTAIMFKRFRK